MSERDDRPAAEETTEGREPSQGLVDGATGTQVGALDGAAAAGGLGAVSGGKRQSAMPTDAPDPTIGPD